MVEKRLHRTWRWQPAHPGFRDLPGPAGPEADRCAKSIVCVIFVLPVWERVVYPFVFYILWFPSVQALPEDLPPGAGRRCQQRAR
jgi:hypothetical protein